MPLHLDSIMPESSRKAFLLELPQCINSCEAVFVSQDNRVFHLTRFLSDTESKDTIGKCVFTIFNDEENKSLNIIDLDITLLSDRAVPIRFLKRLPMSSDANEYYEAATEETEQHFQLETVNRHTVPFDVEGTVQNAYLSAFPFRLSLFDNMDNLNASLGFAEEIQIGKTEYKVHGLSEIFLAPGSAVNPDVKDDETYSFVIGTVKAFRDVSVRFADEPARFTILFLETALGLLPTAVNCDMFHINGLCVGKAVAMCADIKADFVQMQYSSRK